MTYTLEAFKNWLATDPLRYQNLPLWAEFFQLLTQRFTTNELNSVEDLHLFHLHNINFEESDSASEEFNNEIEKREVQLPYRQVLAQWMGKEIPREKIYKEKVKVKFLTKTADNNYNFFLLEEPFKNKNITFLLENISHELELQPYANLDQLTPQEEVRIDYYWEEEKEDICYLTTLCSEEYWEQNYKLKELEHDPHWDEHQERSTQEAFYHNLLFAKLLGIEAFNKRIKAEEKQKQLQLYRLNWERNNNKFLDNHLINLEKKLLEQQNTHQERVKSYQLQLNEKESELQKTREETNISTASLRSEIKELAEQLENAKEENNRLLLLEKQLTEVKISLEESQKKLTNKEQDLTQIQHDNQLLLEKITNLESQLTSQEQLITNLEKSKLEITQKITDLQTNLTDKSLSLEETQEEIEQLQINLLYQQQLSSKFTKEKNEITNSLNFLEEQLISLQKSTSEQLALVEKEKEQSEKSLNNLLSEKHDLVKQNKQLTTDLSKISQEKEKVVNDYKNSQQAIINLKSQLTTLRSEKRNLVSDLKVKNNEITTLQQNISELEAIINDYEKPTENNRESNSSSSPTEKDNWLKNNVKTLLVYGIVVIGSYYLLKE